MGTAKRSLDRHINGHRGQRHYCKYCTVSFSRSDTLRYHMKKQRMTEFIRDENERKLNKELNKNNTKLSSSNINLNNNSSANLSVNASLMNLSQDIENSLLSNLDISQENIIPTEPEKKKSPLSLTLNLKGIENLSNLVSQSQKDGNLNISNTSDDLEANFMKICGGLSDKEKEVDVDENNDRGASGSSGMRIVSEEEQSSTSEV